MGCNSGYRIMYSGTVAGAREAFFYGIPSISISYDWMGGKSTANDFKLSAEACLPIISAILVEVRSKTYPLKCFLNIDMPTDISNHKVRLAAFTAIIVCFNDIRREQRLSIRLWIIMIHL
ncbi:uncharacterized protein LOC141667567 [Apium graveolens]|uniref:uncharacterized protein LOC141667567 n=1 Tax=Apium graveolens TaxID=4045 RepID=UPI003D7949C2